jgi:plastocyanin
MMRFVNIFFLLVGLGLLGVLGDSLVEPPAAGAQAAAEQPMVDFAFEPRELVVPAGTTVVWSNHGATIHTVAPADLSWSSPVLQPGEAFATTFDAPGLYPILCTIHPDMQATVRAE